MISYLITENHCDYQHVNTSSKTDVLGLESQQTKDFFLIC